jgi:hypothetical protein
MRPSPVLTLFAACLASALVYTNAGADGVRLSAGEVTWSIDPQTLALEGSLRDGAPLIVSRGLETTGTLTRSESLDGGGWLVERGGLTASFQPIAGGGIEVELRSEAATQIAWPCVPIATADRLMWAYGKGVEFGVADGFWRTEVMEQEWPAAESLSLPVWGLRRGEEMLSWLCDPPFRTTLSFDYTEPAMSLLVNQAFSEKAPEKRVVHRFFLDQTDDAIVPARHYREYLEEKGKFVPLSAKVERNRSVDLLRGAPHVYLWGGDAITRYDLVRDQWKPFCATLAEGKSPVGEHLRSFFTKEQWAAVVEGATLERPYDYLKEQIAAGLCRALESERFREVGAWETITLSGEGAALRARAEALSPAESLLLNGELLAAAFPGTFLPPRDWGNGVSMKMLKAFGDAGLEHLKLCTDGRAGLARRPWVAEEAVKRGWLIGLYDSYHSVHDPKLAGTDATWETAQMTAELFENGTVTDEAGRFRKGFKGLGRNLNSVVGRGFVEDRVRANLKLVPCNYYFMDCDATGDVFDDYSPGHALSMEEDAAERCRRLGWIGSECGQVVGSEGGNAYAAGCLDVAEGVFGPFFGWDEPAMKDPKSPYFRGRYYPPDAPEVNFKPVPLTERSLRRQYDPAHQVPLYAAVFHDSVVATHHWSNAQFKYPEVRQIVALREVLYLAPPMYHFNLGEFEKRKKQVREHYDLWSPLHRAHGFARLQSFRVLTEDGLVQETVFEGDCRIVANFGGEAFEREGISIPPLSAAINAPAVWPDVRVYTPSP